MAESDKTAQYELLKKDLEKGHLTKKGFDSKVKALLSSVETPDQTPVQNKRDAAEIFQKAKKLVTDYSVKKKQFPLRKDKPKAFLKVKMCPMEWLPKSLKRSGKYVKVVLDEMPPRFLFKGNEGYDDILKMAKDAFWSEDQIRTSTFTLCQSDGTRWTREQFELECGSISGVTETWKKTIYVGRREEDDIVCMGEITEGCDVNKDLECESEVTHTNSVLSSSDIECAVSLRKQDRVSIAHPDAGGLSELEDPVMAHSRELLDSKEPDAGIFECPVRSSSQKQFQDAPQNAVLQVSSNVFTVVPALYLPRIPYVDESQIRYHEEDLLGEGTFGRVFKGYFQGTPAAIKKIVCGTGGCQEADIEHEVLVSLQLSHPNIVCLMAAARLQNAYLLASEYIHGATLADALYNPNCCVKFEGDDQHFVALDVAMAVEYIHSKNITHQDLKPPNVLLEQSSKKAYLADWGMANIRDTVMLTQGSRCPGRSVGPVGGTFLYMAPECLMDFEMSTKQSDMWSLGATYLELFTESLPWEVRNQRDLCRLMSSQTPPHAISKLSEKYRFLSQLLHYDPSLRTQAADLVIALRQVDGPDFNRRFGYAW